MKLLTSGGFLNPKTAQKLGSEWNILKLHLNFETHWMIRRVQLVSGDVTVTSYWRLHGRTSMMTPIFVHLLSSYLSKIFQVSKKNINKQNKIEKRKSGRKSSREKVLLQITLTGASLSEKKRFTWSEKKILHYPYYSRGMEGEGPLFASLTKGTDAFLKECTQD